MNRLFSYLIIICIISCGVEVDQKDDSDSNNLAQIAFVTYDQLCLIKEDGSNFKVIKEGLKGPRLFSWSEKGDALIVLEGENILFIDTLGGVVEAVSPEINSLCFPKSYSNELIVAEGFVDSTSENMQIFIMDFNGEISNVLTNGEKRVINPSLSPDKTRISYAQWDSLSYQIYSQSIDSPYIKTNLSNDLFYNKFPSWSPDGTQIAYLNVSDTDESIWVMDADGGNKRMITNNLGVEIASWSPNSEKIVVQNTSDKGQLLIINVNDTSKKSYLKIDEVEGVFFPVYSPK